MLYSNDSAAIEVIDGTAGVQFKVVKAKTCTGIRVCWKVTSGTETVTVRLRNAAGTILASTTFLATTTKTIYTTTFSSAVDLTSYIGDYLTVSAYSAVENLYVIDTGAFLLDGVTDRLVGDGTLYLQSVFAARK